MNLISNNPYRILGIPVTAGERDIAKQINTLSTYAEMGKIKVLDTDLSFMPPVYRTAAAIEESKKQIEQSENKFFYSLFWFWKNNSVDSEALEFLRMGDTGKAIEIWERFILANREKVYTSQVIYDNLIRQSTAWPEEDNEEHLLKKNEDEYLVNRKKDDNYSVPCIQADLKEDANWSIECDTHWKEGIDNFSYGLAFGRQGGNYYFFGIAALGNFIYGRYNEWEFTPCIDWKETELFNPWASNNLQIKKIGGQLHFYINGSLSGTYPHEPFFGNFFGFKVTKIQKIIFRNFRFCQLVEKEGYADGVIVTEDNFSNCKNLALLYLILATKDGTFNEDLFSKGMTLAGYFFSAEQIKAYAKLIAGDRYVYQPEKVVSFFIEGIIELTRNWFEKSGGISTSNMIQSFSGFPLEAGQYLHDRFAARQIQDIDRAIGEAEELRRNTPALAAEAGKKLLQSTKSDILFLKSALGENAFQYQIIADKLSQALVQCGIEYFNSTKNDEVYLPVYEFAMEVAVTDRAKQKARENVNSCKEWIANKHLYYCWFCEKVSPQEGSEFSITIYKETSRTYSPRRVQFSYVPFKIPRCTSCKKSHAESGNKFGVALLLGLGLGGLIGGLANGHWIIGLLAGGFVGVLAGLGFQEQHLKKAHVKSTNKSIIRNFPPLQKMLKEGWKFSKPTP